MPPAVKKRHTVILKYRGDKHFKLPVGKSRRFAVKLVIHILGGIADRPYKVLRFHIVAFSRKPYTLHTKLIGTVVLRYGTADLYNVIAFVNAVFRRRITPQLCVDLAGSVPEGHIKICISL